MLKVLDLCCKAGGMTKGYQQAGFYVVGVDIEPQPNYIGDEFIQADVLSLSIDFLKQFDLISASPPCWKNSRLNKLNKKEYPELLEIEPVRKLLIQSGKPYVIENVTKKVLVNPIMLCGVMFHLKVFRHRYFETNWGLKQSKHPKHDGVTGSDRWPYKPINGYVQVTGNGGNFTLKSGSEAMQINWMDKKELSQAIPPAYSKYIGEQFLRSLNP